MEQEPVVSVASAFVIEPRHAAGGRSVRLLMGNGTVLGVGDGTRVSRLPGYRPSRCSKARSGLSRDAHCAAEQRAVENFRTIIILHKGAVVSDRIPVRDLNVDFQGRDECADAADRRICRKRDKSCASGMMGYIDKGCRWSFVLEASGEIVPCLAGDRGEGPSPRPSPRKRGEGVTALTRPGA